MTDLVYADSLALWDALDRSRIAASLSVIAAITTMYVLVVPVKPTTVAFTYLVAILLAATGWGIAEATIASIMAFARFNFFFLPPVGT